MKYTAMLSLFALPFCLFADSEVAGTIAMSDRKNTDEKPMGPAMVTLSSARPESANGWFIFADALYWHADIGSTDWVLGGVTTPSGILVQKRKQRSVNFKWNWGFRAGITANLQHDMWDTQLYYTWFHAQAHDRVSIQPPQVNTELLIAGTSIQSGRIHWSIHYSMLDWELGKWFYVSNGCALRPHMGVKGGWIHQGIKEALIIPVQSGGGTEKAHFKNHFWGVGPSFGSNLVWVLGRAGAMDQHRFSLVGDCSGALMYGHFRVKHETTVFDTGGVVTGGSVIQGLNRNLAVAMLRGLIGFGWDVGFNKNRNHFTFQVEYELQYWLRQNQLLVASLGFANGTRRLSDDLALQGLTIDFQFDF